ncbi:1-(5-phosphoribosyl)-5-[(5-phosphoribosylamino)methylideneamino] imidazole-4-carboxamide isomerase [Pilibacter termitis]|uniref:1-(5-phosphoribosyl)-5-[(5-phosphoribosylamino)methylideneamino] imidazole-4-carboxamide isomerase n=1 Tax=Pilibacter termitis TaxID=263852 RepID=A0A1T4LQ51_9ENTE|nr:1-(5-phosphoribosyl)-5-[(5-phosphoribosylamino)methylideneamino]imidazole-4-carboxamide isomerase [Pilibacter termitis]SJZ56815.1 1-(5-phosphoribosyl)-5-[(5-phosphoribosylamino)methylideneamino] imidazole-4-carboxamide isomerase [Pilibacter termitis]
MNILPAIDLKDSQAVRLFQGDFAQKTIVNATPLAQAREFAEGGMKYLHVVDLDGALEARAVHAPLIAKIKQENPRLFVEVGGGIRSMEQVEDYLNQGIDRIIIGSAALTNPEFVKQAVEKFGEKIAVGIDAKDEKVAISGWLEVAETDYITFAKEMVKLGVQTIIYTDISKDGTLAGPSVAHYEKLTSALPTTKIIASGGVSSVEDLRELMKTGVDGAIVGKAFYSGKIGLEEMREIQGGQSC